MTTKKDGEWKPGDPIGYIRPEIPEFRLPAYKGEQYEALVPDTLDLQERARLTIHSLTETTDPLADYELYPHVRFNSNPPVMMHSWWPLLAKHQEGVLLMRLISGSQQNLEVERRWMEVALKSQGPDGLIYTPLRGRPWDSAERSGGKLLQGVKQAEKEGIKIDKDQRIDPFGMGRMLSTMSRFAIRDGGALWKDALRRMVDGLIGLAVERDDFAYFWPNCFWATKEHPTNAEPRPNYIDAESSRVPYGLVKAYRFLGYEPALELAGKVINYLRRFYYTEEGEWTSGVDEPRMAHWHAHSIGLVTMQQYAQTVGDQELMEFVVRSFQYAKNLGVNLEFAENLDLFIETPGANLVGYFPELTNAPHWEGSELCEVADMIMLALLLSEDGVGDYWDDADRWIRNMFAEGQLLSTDWVYHIAEMGRINTDARDFPRSVVGPWATSERVLERCLGAFASNPAANDWLGNSQGIAYCCTDNAAQALYCIWERILRYKEGKLKVNLLLNRASPWANIDSFIPYQGRVDVKVKISCQLSIRIPEWVVPQDTRCQVQGKDRSLAWQGRYAQVGQVKPGDVVSLTFPIEERGSVVYIEKQRFSLIRKGNEVVYMHPSGRFCPLYQREHYRDTNPRWKKVTRFVSDEEIDW